jgi:hypothetical protein
MIGRNEWVEACTSTTELDCSGFGCFRNVDKKAVKNKYPIVLTLKILLF